MKKWTPYISLDCEGQIWNILPGYDNRILLEVRVEASTIHYYDVDIKNGKYERLKHIDVPWWSQALFYAPPYLLIQEFNEEQNPDNVRLHLFGDDSLIWTKDGLRFGEFKGDSLILKSHSGELTHVKLKGFTDRTPFEYPWHYGEGEQYFIDVADFLKARTGVRPVRAIDYYESGESIIMSYYQQNERALRLSLLALHTSGETLLNVDLDKNLSGIADPTFLISKRNVIFVKEKQHFFVYRIADL